jgi:hypothetical protein
MVANPAMMSMARPTKQTDKVDYSDTHTEDCGEEIKPMHPRFYCHGAKSPSY